MSVPDAVPDCKTLTSWTKSPNAVVRDGSVPLEEIKKMLAAGSSFKDYSIGEPTKAKQPGRWNVPVEMSIVRKHNLAVRKDNPAKRYMVDGGI